MRSKRRAISLGVVTPRPYRAALSRETRISTSIERPCTLVCGRPSASIVRQTRWTAMRSIRRFVAVLSLSVDMSHAASPTVSCRPGCRNCSMPAPPTLSSFSIVSGSDSEMLSCPTSV